MKIPFNCFKQALCAGKPQIGLWVALADPNAAEALAGTGFDWLLLDGEHAPNDVRKVLAQLRAVAPYAVHPVVRPVEGNAALIKQYLDIGAQTLLVPMVDSPEQATALVRAMRYPPEGKRGVGAALARAARWGQVENYVDMANEQMCLLVQAESVDALANLEQIAEVDGVDGVFFGAVDLSASMGLRGQPSHPQVRDAILQGIATVRSAGKAPGVLASDRELARGYLDAGALFVAVGVDATLLVRSAQALVREFVNNDPTTAATDGAY